MAAFGPFSAALAAAGLVCRGCLKARARVELISTPERAAYTAPGRLARLASRSPARLYPGLAAPTSFSSRSQSSPSASPASMRLTRAPKALRG
jgi:hypothetical protein